MANSCPREDHSVASFTTGHSHQAGGRSVHTRLRKSSNAHMKARMHAISTFHPVVWAWFNGAFPAPTPAQAQAWPASIVAGRDVLLAAPTGSGKTLAAFLAAIDRLVREGLNGDCRTKRRSSTSRPSRRCRTTSGATWNCRLRGSRRNFAREGCLKSRSAPGFARVTRPRANGRGRIGGRRTLS